MESPQGEARSLRLDPFVGSPKLSHIVALLGFILGLECLDDEVLGCRISNKEALGGAIGEVDETPGGRLEEGLVWLDDKLHGEGRAKSGAWLQRRADRRSKRGKAGLFL